MRQDKQAGIFQSIMSERSVHVSLDPKIARGECVGGALVAGADGVFGLNLPRPVARRRPTFAVPFVEEHKDGFRRLVVHDGVGMDCKLGSVDRHLSTGRERAEYNVAARVGG
jgi:hypothetical protein